MASRVATLRPIEISPTTVQYALPRKNAKDRPAYPKRFYPNEDAKRTINAPWLRFTDPTMPPYPYGREAHFTEANLGLYGGKKIQSGNKISSGRNKGRTLRKWYPNVRVEKLRSEALNIEMDLPVVARVKRTIEKSGGLDQYLLGEKPARLKELGLMGWKLRWMVLKSKAVRERHQKQREELGLVGAKNMVTATFADAWADPLVRQQLIDKMSVGWEQLRAKDTKFTQHVRRVMKQPGERGKIEVAVEDTETGQKQTSTQMSSYYGQYHPKAVVLPHVVEEQGPRRKAPKIKTSSKSVGKKNTATPVLSAEELKVLADRVAEQQSKVIAGETQAEQEVEEVVEGSRPGDGQIQDDQRVSPEGRNV